jgi:HlyD family secretion protein
MKPKLFSILLILFLVVGCGKVASEFEGKASDGVETAVPDSDTTPTASPTRAVQTGTTVLADGQLVALRPALPLSFTGNGRLLTLHVAPGDVVAEGDLIATLDDTALQEAVTNAELQVTQAKNSLAQSQLSLDDLLNWEPDETAVALAEANLAAAQTSLGKAQTQDATAGNSLTSAQVQVDQAERGLVDAQKAYDTAYDPGREWELGISWRADNLKNERTSAERNLQFAQESLQVAQANYSLAVAGLSNTNAISAEASVANAQQALDQATRGPKASEIAAAELRVEQAQISLDQAEFSLTQTKNALDNAQLFAPWGGTILTADTVPGALVSSGTPIVTLFDNTALQFHTNNLSERDLAQVAVGEPVAITLKSYPTTSLTGQVVRIVPQSSGLVGDAAVFTVVIDLDETDLALLAGMTGRAEIQNPQ